MTALLQFEVDKKRLAGFPNYKDQFVSISATQQVWHLIREAAADTFNNGGTLVLVVSDEKITVVQRKEASDFDKPEEKQ